MLGPQKKTLGFVNCCAIAGQLTTHVIPFEPWLRGDQREGMDGGGFASEFPHWDQRAAMTSVNIQRVVFHPCFSSRIYTSLLQVQKFDIY